MTDREVEVAALASLGAWFRRRKPHTAPAGTACANCAAVLEGPYCHSCGQLAEDFHRSLGRLIGELFEGLLEFDGRIWRTLPGLVLKPGRLTRDYLDGHRAVQIPPLRLFLVALLLVFLLGSLGGGSPVSTSTDKASSGKDDNLHVVLRDPSAHAPSDRDVNIDFGAGKADKARANWLKTRIIAAAHDPERFVGAMEAWGHRLAILMLPIGAGLLGLLFVFQRRFFLYDHLIFTMHSLSFQGVLLSGYFLVKLVLPGAAGLLLLAAPVHLFVHMRGVYGRSVIGTLARMSVLFVGSLIGFGLLMLALVFIGLSAMKTA